MSDGPSHVFVEWSSGLWKRYKVLSASHSTCYELYNDEGARIYVLKKLAQTMPPSAGYLDIEPAQFLPVLEGPDLQLSEGYPASVTFICDICRYRQNMTESTRFLQESFTKDHNSLLQLARVI